MTVTMTQKQEIEEIRHETFETRRATVPALEEILFEAIPVLDHGFIRVIDYMGDDGAIVQAARVSYGKGTKKVNEDKGLIHYLMRHRHSTPFEMCEIKFHVKLPIFVARQWIRHRTANVNEYSARYSILDNEFYLPKPHELAVQSKTNRQGRGQGLTPEESSKVIRLLKEESEESYANYLRLLGEDEGKKEKGFSNLETEDFLVKDGLARELARMNLTLNFYTQWYWKIDLHNFMHFLSLRADSHAQYEIRVYAEQMLEVLKRWVPLTYEAFQAYRLQGAHLSSRALDVIRRRLAGETVTQKESGMGQREWDEFMSLLS